jgi:hypothetical protein
MAMSLATFCLAMNEKELFRFRIQRMAQYSFPYQSKKGTDKQAACIRNGVKDHKE